jgi:hypothetical protein
LAWPGSSSQWIELDTDPECLHFCFSSILYVPILLISVAEARDEQDGHAGRVDYLLTSHPGVGTGDQGAPLIAATQATESAARGRGVEGRVEGVEGEGPRRCQPILPAQGRSVAAPCSTLVE